MVTVSIIDYFYARYTNKKLHQLQVQGILIVRTFCTKKYRVRLIFRTLWYIWRKYPGELFWQQIFCINSRFYRRHLFMLLIVQLRSPVTGCIAIPQCIIDQNKYKDRAKTSSSKFLCSIAC